MSEPAEAPLGPTPQGFRRVVCVGPSNGVECAAHAWWYEPTKQGRPRSRCPRCMLMRRWLDATHPDRCIICGGDFPPRPSSRGRPRKYCVTCAPHADQARRRRVRQALKAMKDEP